MKIKLAIIYEAIKKLSSQKNVCVCNLICKWTKDITNNSPKIN